MEWPKGQDLCPDELYCNSICPSSFIKSVKFNKSLQRRNISGQPKRWAERQPVRMKSPRGTGAPAKQIRLPIPSGRYREPDCFTAAAASCPLARCGLQRANRKMGGANASDDKLLHIALAQAQGIENPLPASLKRAILHLDACLLYTSPSPRD